MANWTEADLQAYEARQKSPPVGLPAVVGRVAPDGGEHRGEHAGGARDTAHAVRKDGGPGSTPGAGTISMAAPPRKTKHGNERTRGVDGRTYDSRLEARRMNALALQKAAGDIVAAIPQVSLPCGEAENGRAVRYRADALVIRELLDDGWFIGRFEDPKGHDTERSRAKRAAIRMFYGIDVQLVRAA